MKYSITVLGGPSRIRINDGPWTELATPTMKTLVLSVDGVEVDRKTVAWDAAYKIAIQNGKVWLMIDGEKEEPEPVAIPQAFYDAFREDEG